MEHWEDHGFAETGPLKKAETHVNVYEDEEGNEKWQERTRVLKPPHYPRVNPRAQQWEETHEQYRQEMRRSPMYQFVMLVASFANLRLNQMWRTPAEDPSKASGSADETAGQLGSIGNNIQAGEQFDFQHRWTSSPLISGHLYLSPKVFGHLMEAEDLVRNCTGTTIALEDLMKGKTRVLFARLVAIRINMSAFLSGLNYQLDRNYRRLMTQQTMLLRAMKAKLGSVSKMRPLPASELHTTKNMSRTFNSVIGMYN
jgi:hypothetical protein